MAMDFVLTFLFLYQYLLYLGSGVELRLRFESSSALGSFVGDSIFSQALMAVAGFSQRCNGWLCFICIPIFAGKMETGGERIRDGTRWAAGSLGLGLEHAMAMALLLHGSVPYADLGGAERRS